MIFKFYFEGLFDPCYKDTHLPLLFIIFMSVSLTFRFLIQLMSSILYGVLCRPSRTFRHIKSQFQHLLNSPFFSPVGW
jgi:hypothetical protein